MTRKRPKAVISIPVQLISAPLRLQPMPRHRARGVFLVTSAVPDVVV
ncbi:hypothetical protein QJS66_00485 [Kocuria rhizophila]|nr:hypothetical protein QJS66_00485 [Kocuria rhizophila]